MNLKSNPSQGLQFFNFGKRKGSYQEPLNLGMTAREFANYKNIFLLSERGYTKLVAMMSNDNEKNRGSTSCRGWLMNNFVDIIKLNCSDC